MSKQKETKNQSGKKKNIFSYFKHLAKDPAKTVEEANSRLNTLTIIFLASIALSVLSFLAPILFGLPDVVSILFIVGFAGIIYCLIALNIVKKHRARVLALQCSSCKSMVTYDENTEYDVLDAYEKKITRTSDGRTTVTQFLIVKIGIDCKCGQCGTAKHIEREFAKEEWVNGNPRYRVNDDQIVRGFLDGSILPL